MRYRKWHAGACKFATVNYDKETKKIIHMSEAAPHHVSYTGHNGKCVSGNRAPLRLFGRGK